MCKPRIFSRTELMAGWAAPQAMGKSSKARVKYLNQCNCDNSGSTETVNDKYGQQRFPAL